MHPIEDQKPLKGVARSLDDLFARAERGRDRPASEPGPAEGPADPQSDLAPAPEVGAIMNMVEDSTGADGMAQDLSPTDATPPVDPREERRARIMAVAQALTNAVERFISGDGDLLEVTRSIREGAMDLREENALEPVVDTVERLMLAGPPDDSDPAAIALARQLGTPGVCAGLALRLAGARDDARREELTRACNRLGEEAAIAVVRALSEADDRSDRRSLVTALAAMGEHGMRQVEAMVQDGTWVVVRNGVSILSELGGERAIEHLIGTLSHHHPKVRRETVQALGRLGGESATLLVIGKLDDPDEDVRATAARALGTLGAERATRTLLARLEVEPNEEVQEEILRALGQLGDPGAVPAIEKRAVGSFLNRPPAAVRIAAYRALALLTTPHAKALLEGAAEDKDPEVRTVVRSLLGKG